MHCFDLQPEKNNSEEKPLNDPNSEVGFEEFLRQMEQERQEKDRGRPPMIQHLWILNPSPIFSDLVAPQEKAEAAKSEAAKMEELSGLMVAPLKSAAALKISSG